MFPRRKLKIRKQQRGGRSIYYEPRSSGRAEVGGGSLPGGAPSQWRVGFLVPGPGRRVGEGGWVEGKGGLELLRAYFYLRLALAAAC
uniref:Putative basic tail protein n=1 Tax=Ixodes ricinus TaxID=34613 RepID=A0A0K8R6R1_IXORI